MVLSSLPRRKWIPSHLVSPVDSFPDARYNQPGSFPAVEVDRPSKWSNFMATHHQWWMGVHCLIFRVFLGSKRLLLIKTKGDDLIGCLFLLFIQSCCLATGTTYSASKLSFSLCGSVNIMIMGVIPNLLSTHVIGTVLSTVHGITMLILPTGLCNIIIFFFMLDWDGQKVSGFSHKKHIFHFHQ